jgi:hypothetical protein
MWVSIYFLLAFLYSGIILGFSSFDGQFNENNYIMVREKRHDFVVKGK